MNIKPRLKDGHRLVTKELFKLNEIPDDVVVKIGSYLICLLYIGRKDVSGADWGDSLAYSVGGTHLDSPVGIADVVLDKTAWSAKTVKSVSPFSAKQIRLISGRCSPDFSYGITDPHADIQKTGEAVLNIWNERINIAYDHYNPVRTSILIRSGDMLSYVLFEEENHRYRTSDYLWETNSNGNLIARHIDSGKICFTWQPHGSQLTIHTTVPPNPIKFKIRQPPVLAQRDVLNTINFDSSWVEILKS